VIERFSDFVEAWAAVAVGENFSWAGEVDPAEIREIAAHWFRVTKLTEEPDSGLTSAPPEAEPFYNALVRAMTDVVAVEDNQGFAEKFEEIAPAFAPPAEVGSEPATEADDGRPRRVLLVDDTADIRLLIRFSLEFDPRFEVFAEANDGQEALDACERACPDLILLDLMMPVMDGFTALPLLRDRCPNAKVVVLTAVEESDTRRRASELGAAAFLTKLAGMDEIKSTLAAVS
jgi:CheY-like chemotaxis protein